MDKPKCTHPNCTSPPGLARPWGASGICLNCAAREGVPEAVKAQRERQKGNGSTKRGDKLASEAIKVLRQEARKGKGTARVAAARALHEIAQAHPVDEVQKVAEQRKSDSDAFKTALEGIVAASEKQGHYLRRQRTPDEELEPPYISFDGRAIVGELGPLATLDDAGRRTDSVNGLLRRALRASVGLGQSAAPAGEAPAVEAPNGKLSTLTATRSEQSPPRPRVRRTHPQPTPINAPPDDDLDADDNRALVQSWFGRQGEI